jgi:hypothetical protein
VESYSPQAAMVTVRSRDATRAQRVDSSVDRELLLAALNARGAHL